QLYGLGEFTTPANGGNTSRIGLDASVPVTATSSFVATLHPDYSNVEIDQQTIAPSAFPRQFAEVRPFFTQVNPNFNNSLACLNCPQTLYTPAIPTFRDGFAYEGTAGPLSFSAFDTDTRDRTDNAQTVTYVKQDASRVEQLGVQRVSVNVPGFENTATTVASGYENQHSHMLAYLNAGEVTGTGINTRLARYLEYGLGYQTKTTTAIFDMQTVGRQFFPADGFVNQVDIRGFSFFGGRTINFSSSAPLHDIVINGYDDVYRDHHGRLAQVQQGGQVNFDFHDLLSLHVFGGYHAYRTFAGELLPFANTGASLGYKLSTSTPQSISFSGGPFYHGNLTSWSYVSTIPAGRGLSLNAEADENLYVPRVAAEPVSRQWLERVALDWQFSKVASADVGLRRIIGRNLPNAFSTPDLPTAAAPLGVVNGFSPFDYVSATNVSFAVHVLLKRQEFYFVYGDPNSLTTTPALYIKWIHYWGADKGT
ncbi:MAG TPA: hypothetical protein VK665_16270, partial [Candidatus Elarobacter sp.]|nr:hypothetical protein [Candidatus Elarobacter sp.]